MNWYYADAGQQVGPITEADWDALVRNGTVKDDTLVWREGMEKWSPYASVASAPASMAAPAAATFAAPAAVAEGTVRCSECANVFPADDVVMIDGQPVCAACKPLAVQKLKEGVALTGTMRYGGFWIRFGAKFIDGIILQIIARGIGLVLGMSIGAAGSTNATLAAILGGALGLLAAAGYSIFFNGKYGATPGKMACKLRVVRADGAPISFGRATGRYFAEMLSGVILAIGYLMAAFDEEKRSLHDRLCDTRVIRS